MRSKTIPYLLSLTLFLLVGSTVSAHKFYMSIADMEYHPESKSLQVVVKLFVDDFEKVLEQKNAVRLFLGTDKEHPEADNYIKKYLNSHFIVEQPKGSLSATFVGKEVDKDYLWVYFEFKKFKVKESSTLYNSLLIKEFPTQTNKVNYKNGKQNKSFTLYKSKLTEEF